MPLTNTNHWISRFISFAFFSFHTYRTIFQVLELPIHFFRILNQSSINQPRCRVFSLSQYRFASFYLSDVSVAFCVVSPFIQIGEREINSIAHSHLFAAIFSLLLCFAMPPHLIYEYRIRTIVWIYSWQNRKKKPFSFHRRLFTYSLSIHSVTFEFFSISLSLPLSLSLTVTLFLFRFCRFASW